MASGTGLARFAEEFPDRFFDVGIAEQHAVTMAGGQALGGLKPVAAIYSTFLQRAHDQVVHDICLQDIPVVFAMDRSGIVGADGATHQGLFDIAFLRDLPNMVLMAPTDEEEMHRMFRTALELEHPSAIRYPRGSTPVMERTEDFLKKMQIGKAVTVEEGQDLAILAYGTILDDIRQALPMLHEQGLYPRVINARFAKPIDRELIAELAHRNFLLVTAEEHVLAGGFGSRVLEVLEEEQLFSTGVLRLGVPDRFIEHGDRAGVLDQMGLSPGKMAERIMAFYKAHRPAQIIAPHHK
jgi:1-deoxy-D-xylulose-5-phosphate synthase